MSQQLTAAMESLRIVRTHHRASCFRITRDDGTIFRFTDHNATIRLLVDPTALYAAGDPYESFVSATSIDASSAERGGDLDGTNIEARGIVSSDLISEDDLEAGLFDGALVEEFVVDWRFPWAGPFFKLVYHLGEISYSSEMWVAQVEGLGRELRAPVGDTYTRTGRVKSTPVHTKTSQVNGIVTQRLVFTTAAGTLDTTTGAYNYGKIVWTSGLNTGVESVVRVMTNIGGPIPIQFELMLETPHDLSSGDDFTVDKVEFEDGYPFLPGTGTMRQTPPEVSL